MRPLPMKSQQLDDLLQELSITQNLIFAFTVRPNSLSGDTLSEETGPDIASENQIARSLISMHSLLTVLNPLMREHLTKRT